MSRREALVAAVLLAAAAFPALAGSEQAEAARPRLSVAPERFDFGRALPERALRKSFTLRNSGDAELVIAKVTTSCGCTATELASTRLAPGRSTPLTVTLTTSRRPGRMEKSVLVSSNDPQTPVFELKLFATVEQRAPAK